MAWTSVLVLSLTIGWLLARALTGKLWGSPKWASLLAQSALAVLLGPGIASIAGFALFASRAATSGSIYTALAILVVGSGALWWLLRGAPPQSSAHDRRFPWVWGLAAALAAGCVLVVLDFSSATQANPDGEWDATAIWNLRARFLAGGPETWRRAISAETGGFMVGASHPGYPLFLSSLLGMMWTATGSYGPAAPAALSLLFSAGLATLLVASLAIQRSASLGLLAGLVLIASELVVSQASAQYADLLLGLAFLSTIVLLQASAESDSRFAMIAAGLAIGFAPWIKNEGMPFAIAAAAAALWRFKVRAVWVLAGSLPGLIAVGMLKLMAEGREIMFPTTVAELFSKLATPSRWIQSLTGFGKGVFDAGPWWAHPVILVVALAVVLRFVPAAERRARIWLAVPIAGTLAAEYGLYLITAADLTWHISTSAGRLLAQVWPSLLYLTFSVLRAPEEYFVTPSEFAPFAVHKSGSSPNKRKRAGA